jgi:MFS family permease
MNQNSLNDLQVQKRNIRNVQVDGVGVSLSNIAAPYLPVFLTRLGASNFQVGLLSSMPGMTGLLLAVFVGQFLQTRKNVVPWYSLSRLLVVLCYALTGILTLVLAEKSVIAATLIIWAAATLPQIVLAVAFTVVMNAVAGPEGRYALLSRRWAILGVSTVIGTFIVTRVIDLIAFPINYAVMFLVLSLGGFLSYYFSNQLQIPDQVSELQPQKKTFPEQLKDFLALLRANPAFVSFASKRFVYLSALALSLPVMPLYYVRKVNATDSQIGTFSMAMTMVMLAGYFLWPRLSRLRGGRFVLLATTFGMIFYPALTAATTHVNTMILISGLAGLFQSGLDLVFFDELMKVVPAEQGATFVAMAQAMQYLSTVLAPLIGAWVVSYIDLSGALWLSAGLRLIGFLLFLRRGPRLSA